MDAFLRRLPKVELHAHLNGSVSRETIRQLLAAHPPDSPLHAEFAEFERQCSLESFSSFFGLFRFVYAVTGTKAAIRAIAKQVVLDFEADGCTYLELRSTPRCGTGDLGSKQEYVDACLAGTQDALQELAARGVAMDVKWILSLDRRHSLEAGLDTVDLAVANMHRGVVGVDLCGDPEVGGFLQLKPAFSKARAAGLKVTLHMAEIESQGQDTIDMLDFGPDRIGHGTFLSGESRDRVIRDAIPIEVCLSSNVIGMTVPSIEEHHFNHFHFQGHPCVLCTDDRGVFACSLVHEYSLVEKHFRLSHADMVQLALKSVDYIFADNETKQRVRSRIDAFKAAEAL
ncbi:hypothetical protein HK105_201844 [Polyrhizophydium stewartii]|uniref:Adenosine deaminase domain-containing protein n=1 Tax=Polyrhizophydium stewartii TaxID=2732419 RepID=A0ABR4NFY3_9FUNG|nr:hypothetical protein HK105_006154 [Polyrhizophydium stewartii]